MPHHRSVSLVTRCVQVFEAILLIGYNTLFLSILQQFFCFNELSVNCQWTVGSLSEQSSWVKAITCMVKKIRKTVSTLQRSI